jgi:hypothetical protein
MYTYCVEEVGWRELTFPTVLEHYAKPALDTVTVDGVGRVNYVQQYIVEKGLEGWDRGPDAHEERTERVRGRNAEC